MIRSQTNKSLLAKRFSLEKVLSETDDVLIHQLNAELPKKPLRSGADMRVNSLRTLCQLMESQNRKLSQIFDLLLDLDNKKGDSHN